MLSRICVCLLFLSFCFFFFKQKTAYEMRISDWSSDVCSSDLDAVGVALLLRGRRGVQVTPAGRTLLHHARSVLQQVDRMRGELDLYGQGLKGHVRLLCNTSALSEYLPDILGGFLAQHSQISVDLEERMSYDIADAIRSGIADIGIVADSVDLQALATHTFRPDPLTLIVPMNHQLAQRHSISLAEVAHHDLVGLHEGSAQIGRAHERTPTTNTQSIILLMS